MQILPNTVRLIKSDDTPASLLVDSVYLPSSDSCTLLMTRLCLSGENVRLVSATIVIELVVLNCCNCHIKLSGLIRGNALLSLNCKVTDCPQRTNIFREVTAFTRGGTVVEKLHQNTSNN